MSEEKKKMEKVVVQVPAASLRVEEVRCPKGCDLMDRSVPIHGHPSIALRFSIDDREGTIHLDPHYGTFDNISDIEIPKGKIVELRCPHCGVSLQEEDERCGTCSSPLFALHLPKGGLLEGCLKSGCFYHTLRIVDLDAHFLRVSRDEIGMSRYDV
ncbi:MAG: hypothetical protein ABIK65_03180 [Candidatus Eisenbacteria bacterium]